MAKCQRWTQSPRGCSCNRKVYPGVQFDVQREEKVERAAILVMFQPPTPARESTAWIHAPSQPLMQSPLSRSQTPAAPRRACRFFRVWACSRLPCQTGSPSLLRTSEPFRTPTLSAVDGRQANCCPKCCQRPSLVQFSVFRGCTDTFRRDFHIYGIRHPRPANQQPPILEPISRLPKISCTILRHRPCGSTARDSTQTKYSCEN